MGDMSTERLRKVFGALAILGLRPGAKRGRPLAQRCKQDESMTDRFVWWHGETARDGRRTTDGLIHDVLCTENNNGPAQGAVSIVLEGRQTGRVHSALT